MLRNRLEGQRCRLAVLLVGLTGLLWPGLASSQTDVPQWAMSPAAVLGAAATVLLLIALLWVALLQARFVGLNRALREYRGMESDIPGTPRRRLGSEYRQLVEESEAAIAIVRDGRVAFVNQAVADLLGWPNAGDLHGTPAMDHVFEADRETAAEHMRRLAEGGEAPGIYEVRMIRKDGSTVWVEFASSFRMFEGRPALQSAMYDVTHRKQAEEALRRQHSLVERITATSPAGISVLDRDGNITFANTAAEEVLGLSRDEITLLTYNAPEWRITDFAGNPFPDAELPFSRVKETLRSVYNIRHAIEWPDGRQIRLAINASPLFDEHGEFDGMVAVIEDVTQRTRAEEIMRASEEKYSRLFHYSNDSIFLHDTEGAIIDLNQRGLDMLEYSREEALALSISDLHPSTQLDISRAAFEKIAEEGYVAFEIDFLTKSGRIVPAEVSARLFELEGRKVVQGIVRDISERRKAEQALRESEQEKNLILSSVPDLVSFQNTDLKMVWANKACGDSVGKPAAELVGRYCYEIWHQRDEPCEDCPVTRAIETGQTQECLMRTPDGRVWQVKGQPVVDAGGAIIGAVEVTQEVTEQVRALEALKESEERFRSAFMTSPDAVSINRLDDGRFVDVNEGFTTLTGLAREDVAGHTAQEVGIQQDPDSQARMLADLRATGEVRNLECEFTFRHGGRRWGLMSIRAAALGGEPHTVAIVRDIGDWKQAQQALRESEERYRELIENMGEGMVLANLEETLLFANPAAERTFGVESGLLVGRNMREFLSDDQFAILQAATARRREGIVESYEVEITRPDGQTRNIRITASPRFDGEGRYTGSFGPIRDITDQAMLERQLRQAQKMEALGTLAGGIAHDFNNILYAILGFTTLALEKVPADGSVHADLQEVLSAGERAADLVKQILSFSRQAEQEAVPLHVHLIVHEAAKLMRASVPKRIEIRKTVQKGDDVVLADPTQIHQVLMNLCTNAVHAMPKGDGILGIELAPIEVDAALARQVPDLLAGPYLRLRVSDTGEGMPAEMLERIFDPFFTTKEPGEGTGLGLAVVHGIVAGCGGAVHVQSKPDAGTVFDVYFPRYTDSTPSTQDPARPPQAGRERILVVEDEDQIARMLAETLTRLGYRVTSASRGDEALSLFTADPQDFDLVLTDQAMPGMMGTELAGELLKLRPELPIVLCTGFSHVLSEEDTRQAGIRELVMKPIMRSELSEAIRRALGRPADEQAMDS